MSDRASIAGGRPLLGVPRVPGDKSISHRGLLLAALAEGPSELSGLSGGDDVVRTARAVAALGAEVTGDDPVVVHGGRERLAAPAVPLDLGNSGTGMRLLAGVAAGIGGTTVLDGDASLRSRPMDRVAVPLERMGAVVEGRGERCLPPLRVTGGRLVGIDYTPPMASAQVKSAVLLAGLAADGETVVREPVATRAHTEELLAQAGADIAVTEADGGRVVRLAPSRLRPLRLAVPGDPSQAAFFVVGAVVVPGSAVVVEHVYLGPARAGFLDVLARMGAPVEVVQGADRTGTVEARAGALTGTVVQAAEIPSLDEVPVLAVAAAVAEGPTRFADVGELRVKESDRLAGVVDLLAAFGARATVDGDDLVVAGGARLRPGTVEARGDHRLAMAAAIAGAACEAGAGVTTVEGWECVATSYPGFAEVLAELQDGRG